MPIYFGGVGLGDCISLLSQGQQYGSRLAYFYATSLPEDGAQSYAKRNGGGITLPSQGMEIIILYRKTEQRLCQARAFIPSLPPLSYY